MIKKLLKLEVASNCTVAAICGAMCSLAGALVLVLGFQRLERFDFNEVQLYSATVETLVLSSCFVGLAVLFTIWKRAA